MFDMVDFWCKIVFLHVDGYVQYLIKTVSTVIAFVPGFVAVDNVPNVQDL